MKIFPSEMYLAAHLQALFCIVYYWLWLGSVQILTIPWCFLNSRFFFTWIIILVGNCAFFQSIWKFQIVFLLLPNFFQRSNAYSAALLYNDPPSICKIVEFYTYEAVFDHGDSSVCMFLAIVWMMLPCHIWLYKPSCCGICFKPETVKLQHTEYNDQFRSFSENTFPKPGSIFKIAM